VVDDSSVSRCSTGEVFGGELGEISLPGDLVIVAQHWPSALVVAASLKLPISAAYVNTKFTPFLSSLSLPKSLVLHATDLFFDAVLPHPVTLVGSGSLEFFTKVKHRLIELRSFIWIFEQPLRGCSHSSATRFIRNTALQCSKWGMCTRTFPHSRYGGATNASHLVVFGPEFDELWLDYVHPPNVSRSIRHFWNTAAKGRSKLCAPLPPLTDYSCSRPIFHNGHLRLEGLLPTHNPFHHICGSSVFKPGKTIVRRLTPTELLRIFDLPMSIDSACLPHVQWDHNQSLPFENAISPTVLTSIFRHMWSVSGGVVLGINAEPAAVAAAKASALVTCAAEGDSGSDICGRDEISEVSTLDDSTVDSDADLPDLALRDDFSDDSTLNSDSDLPELELHSTQSTLEVDIYWDVESDDDSFMPRKPATKRSDKKVVVEMPDWSGLDDESTILLGCSDTSETATMTSYLPGEADNDLSSLSSIDSESTGSLSQASQATVKTVNSSGVPLASASRETLEQITKATIGLKAVKADDAKVPVYLWDRRIVGEDPTSAKARALRGFRKFGLRMFWKCLWEDCRYRLHSKWGATWFNLPVRSKSGKLTNIGREREAMRNLLWHATEASWFEYKAGSRVYHFRFPIRYQRIARDGVPVFFEQPGPSVMQPQPEFKDPEVRERVREKVTKVMKRRYVVRLTTGLDLKSLIKYFAVPKGLDDIRIVYDGTASGLNDAVWAPSFWLPTIDSLVRALDADSWMSDRDIGDMFLNFQLHESVWPFAGVDVGPILDEQGKISEERWYYWVRNAMGFKSSPYNSIKMALVAEEVIVGDRHDVSNPFQWSRVRLNLPGSKDYDPSASWISKVRADDMMACVLFTFVDDERIVGATEELAWQASHRLAQIQSYLGIQDAARKVGLCLQQPRAWAGAVVHAMPGEGVFVLTSEEKWTKMKSIVAKWLGKLKEGVTNLPHKELLSDRGFLVYVTRAYPSLIPYIKGFHLTVEMWRGNRDDEGWKLPVPSQEKENVKSTSADEDDEDAAVVRFRTQKKTQDVPRAPESGFTPPAPRLLSDLEALTDLTRAELPPLRLARPKNVIYVTYGFGDASGTGRGTTFQGFRTIHHSSGELGPTGPVRYKIGTWGSDSETTSSNYRELNNLVEETEAEARAGRLSDSELFLFTDNSTAESAFYKGSSSSRILHHLVLRLHKIALDYRIILHVIHVSGKRMIAQGTDGCSRGVLLEGVMAGEDMLSFIDLDKPATQRCSKLLDWIRSWTMSVDLSPLTPEEWFVEGHGICGGYRDRHGVWMPSHEPPGKIHLWAPPPAVADAALEELLKARHKRTDTFHIVAIPRLMAPRWRRLFHKVCDLHFVVPPGCEFWTSDMYEPLWVGIVLPFVSFRPWSIKRSPLMVELARQLCEVCKDSPAIARNILRKLLKLPGKLASVSPGVARGMLHMPREGKVSVGYTS